MNDALRLLGWEFGENYESLGDLFKASSAWGRDWIKWAIRVSWGYLKELLSST